MNRFFLTSIMSMLMFAFAAAGQETAPKRGGAAQDSLPAAEQQIKVLSEKLDLTAGQQLKISPIMQQLHDATVTILEHQTLSRDQRLAKVRPLRRLADQKIRGILSPQQGKKLDAYEAGPHDEMHGTLTGAPKH
jgi:Spy/CpxP family protein refolding chaperone